MTVKNWDITTVGAETERVERLLKDMISAETSGNHLVHQQLVSQLRDDARVMIESLRMFRRHIIELEERQSGATKTASTWVPIKVARHTSRGHPMDAAAVELRAHLDRPPPERWGEFFVHAPGRVLPGLQLEGAVVTLMSEVGQQDATLRDLADRVDATNERYKNSAR